MQSQLIKRDEENFYIHNKVMSTLGPATIFMIELQEAEKGKDGYFVYSWNQYIKRYGNCTRKEFKEYIKTLKKYKIIETESREGKTFYRFLDEKEAIKLIDKEIDRKTEEIKERLGYIPDWWQETIDSPWEEESDA